MCSLVMSLNSYSPVEVLSLCLFFKWLTTRFSGGGMGWHYGKGTNVRRPGSSPGPVYKLHDVDSSECLHTLSVKQTYFTGLLEK